MTKRTRRPVGRCAAALAAVAMAVTADAAEERVSVDLHVANEEVQVAEPVRVVLSATAPRGWSIELPETPSRFEELKVITAAVRRTQRDAGTVVLAMHLELESLLPGRYRVGPLDVRFTPRLGNGDPERSAETIRRSTRSIPVRVRSAIGLLESRELREIYGPVRIAWSWWQWAAAAAVTVSVLAVGRAVYRRITRWLSSPRISQRALLRELDRLDEARLGRSIPHDRLITAAADIVRQSLRLAESAEPVYRTTDEWIQYVRAARPNIPESARNEPESARNEPESARNEPESVSTEPGSATNERDALPGAVQFVLREADAIKFAGKPASLDQVRRCFDAARSVVQTFLGDQTHARGGGPRS